MAKSTRGAKPDPEKQQVEPEQKRPAEQSGGERTHSRRTFRPSVDIYEVENGLMLLAHVPGATREGVTITLERRALTVHARVEDDGPAGYSLVYQEYEVGDYECQFALAGEFDADKIEAGLTNGVVRLTISRGPQRGGRTKQSKTRAG